MIKGKSPRNLFKVRQFIVVALSVFALLASFQAQGAMPPVHLPPPPSQGRVTTHTQPAKLAFDARWLQSNINLHRRMIAQSKIEASLTTSTTIKTFANDMVTSLGLEVTQMQTWLTTWYGINPPAASATPPAPKDPAVVALNSQDLVYLNQVILYEHSIIIEGLFPASKAIHAELKAFAKKEVVGAQGVLPLVNSWQDLLIKMILEQLFQ